ncbi:MAG: hypothetical protein R2850_09060 [Bacteroidia bacterium]
MEYGQQYENNSSYSFTYEYGFNGIDSIRTDNENMELNEVLGWGTLSVGGSNFNALMLKKTYIYS